MRPDRHALFELAGPHVWFFSRLAVFIQSGEGWVCDQRLCDFGDLGHSFAGEHTRIIQSFWGQLDRVWYVLAWLSLTILLGVLHYVGQLGPDVLVYHKSVEQILGI